MKTLKITFLAISLLAAVHHSFSQDSSSERDSSKDKVSLSSKKSEVSLGVGIGLPYGAIGFRAGVNLADHLNLFGGLGYQISGVGYNFGLMKDFKSKGSAQFYLVAMYGTNAAIKIIGLEEYDKVYTGPTFGMGIKINSRRTQGNYWDLGLLLPVKSSAYFDAEKQVQNDPRIESFTAAWPILFSIGYNMNL